MLYIGLSWLLWWLVVTVFTMEQMKAAILVAIVFIVLGLIFEGRTLLPRRQ